MAASHEWPLTIQGAEQDYPRLLSLKRVGGGAEVVYKATVEGPVCLLTSEKADVWAWQHAHGGAPVTPKQSFQAGDAVELLDHVKPTDRTEPVHKGSWRGTFRAGDHGPVVTLTRKVATHIQVVITSDPRSGSWDVRVERNATWWGPARGEKGTAKPSSLGAAMREGYAIAGGLSGEVCGVRETTRREALDSPFAAKRKEVQEAKAAAKPPSLKTRAEDATAGWIARLAVPQSTRQPGYAGFPAAEGRMDAVIGYLRQHGHTVAAASLQSWHKQATGGSKNPRALGDVAEAAANLLRAKYGGKRPKGAQVDDYNAAVAVLGTLLGGVVPPRLQMLPPPSCASSARALADGAAADARAIDADLTTWSTAKAGTPWDDWRTSVLRRTAGLIDKACALVRSPLCVGGDRTEAVKAVRTAMDAYDRFRDAAMAEAGGQRAARARVLPVLKKHGEPPVHAVQPLEGPDKGRTITLTPLQRERNELAMVGSTVFVHYDPGLLLGSLTQVRLDPHAQGRELAYGDSVRTLRYLAETAAVAATRAAKACGKKPAAGGAACPVPSHTGGTAAPTAVYQCDRCGFLAHAKVLHLAIGSVLCPAGTSDFKLVAHPTAAQEREASEAGRWTVRDEEHAPDPVMLPEKVPVDILRDLPIGSVVVAFDAAGGSQWPALAIRIGKASEDRWGQWSMAAETVEDKAVGSSSQLAGILSDGRFKSTYILVQGRGRREDPWTSKAVARGLAKLPESRLHQGQTDKHAAAKREAKVNREARAGLVGKPYGEWGRDAWEHVAATLGKTKGVWAPKHGGKVKWIRTGSVDGTGPTPGVVVQLTGMVKGGEWFAGWKTGGMEEMVKLGPFSSEEAAKDALILTLKNGGEPPAAKAPAADKGRRFWRLEGPNVTGDARQLYGKEGNAVRVGKALVGPVELSEVLADAKGTTVLSVVGTRVLVPAPAAQAPPAPSPRPRGDGSKGGATKGSRGVDAKIGAAVGGALDALAAKLLAGRAA